MKERRARSMASRAEASFFIELLVPFVSRQKTLATPAAMSGKNNLPIHTTKFLHAVQDDTCIAL